MNVLPFIVMFIGSDISDMRPLNAAVMIFLSSAYDGPENVGLKKNYKNNT